MPRLPNEFLDSLDDNRIRPYTNGMRYHNETLATILLYTDNQDELEESDDIKYLNTLTDKVKLLTPEVADVNGNTALKSGTPQDESGKIAAIQLDGTNIYYGVFNNFSLLNVAESSEQIVKLHVNFGADWNAFFFGEKPKIYQFSGFFIDSMEYPYYQEFLVAYEGWLSGRRAIENKMRTKFIYDGKMVDGYMLNINTTQTAADQLIKRFEFTVLVRGFHWIRTNVIAMSTTGIARPLFEERFNGMSNKYRLRALPENDIGPGNSSVNTVTPEEPLIPPAPPV